MGQKNGVTAEEDKTLNATFEMGKLDLSDDELEEDNTFVIVGTGKVRFDTAIRTAKNAGNGEESIGTPKTCSSAISEDKKRRREERKHKDNKRANKNKHIATISKTTSSNATSSLTSQTLNVDTIKKKWKKIHNLHK